MIYSTSFNGNCVLLGYYATSSGNLLLTFRDIPNSGVTRIFFDGGLRQEFFSGGSTNSVEDRGQRERGDLGEVAP
jgi:hypothetical protein